MSVLLRNEDFFPLLFVCLVFFLVGWFGLCLFGVFFVGGCCTFSIVVCKTSCLLEQGFAEQGCSLLGKGQIALSAVRFLVAGHIQSNHFGKEHDFWRAALSQHILFQPFVLIQSSR